MTIYHVDLPSGIYHVTEGDVIRNSIVYNQEGIEPKFGSPEWLSFQRVHRRNDFLHLGVSSTLFMSGMESIHNEQNHTNSNLQRPNQGLGYSQFPHFGWIRKGETENTRRN